MSKFNKYFTVDEDATLLDIAPAYLEPGSKRLRAGFGVAAEKALGRSAKSCTMRLLQLRKNEHARRSAHMQLAERKRLENLGMKTSRSRDDRNSLSTAEFDFEDPLKKIEKAARIQLPSDKAREINKHLVRINTASKWILDSQQEIERILKNETE